MPELAIKGGERVRNRPFPNQLSTILNSDSIRDIESDISDLLHDRVFSHYRGNATESFWGGEWVRKVEKALTYKIGCENVLAVNSCTSALFIACVAINLHEGDEVIVTPWSMSCSATIPLFFGATPVFADIEYDTFCLDPNKVIEKITGRTKAIIVVDLFGHPADYERLNKIAKEHHIYIIEDAAQAIGSYIGTEDNSERFYSGTLGDIGCFSFTQGKHFTSGEGGAIICNDDRLYHRCSLIRNHAEAVINDYEILRWKTSDEVNFIDNNSELVGGNFRMTEIQAIILYEQLKKWDEVIQIRRDNVERLKEIQRIVPYIEVVKPRPNVYHSYYVMPFYFKYQDNDITREMFLNAVKAELTEEEGRIDRGIPISGGYIQPLYLMPLFQAPIDYRRLSLITHDYKKGDCKVCEHLWEKEFFLTLYHGLPLTKEDCDDIIEAFYKVYKNIDELRNK